MNYYKQFAEMLGLELGQEFRIIGSHGKTIDNALYEITEDGLFSKANDLSGKVTSMLDLLLSGDYKAVPKPWKPQNDKKYWCYNSGDGAVCAIWKGSTWDLLSWKIGNCFRTEKEAWDKGQKLIEQIQKEYEEA